MTFQAFSEVLVWQVPVTCHVESKPVDFASRKDSEPITSRSESFKRG